MSTTNVELFPCTLHWMLIYQPLMKSFAPACVCWFNAVLLMLWLLFNETQRKQHNSSGKHSHVKLFSREAPASHFLYLTSLWQRLTYDLLMNMSCFRHHEQFYNITLQIPSNNRNVFCALQMLSRPVLFSIIETLFCFLLFNYFFIIFFHFNCRCILLSFYLFIFNIILVVYLSF